MTEFPISTVELSCLNLPIAGGGYFRLFPYWFTRIALRNINNKEKQPFIIYLHPREVDPKQPRIKEAGAKLKFRHYLNLDKTMDRLERLLQDCQFCPVIVPNQ